MNAFLQKHKDLILHVSHMTVLVLSVALIAYISYDTFSHVSILDNSRYMTFQFWVCMIFLMVFFVDMYFDDKPWRYFYRNILFLIICIPYLNIVGHLNVTIDADQLYLLRFIPLIRGAMALAIIISYLSKSKINSLFFTYISIMVMVVYFSSLIFFEREHPVNNQITNYWMSLWWCCLETTTIGAPINPVTVVGKVLAGVLSCMGMMMFPLFTVYLTNIVKKYMR